MLTPSRAALALALAAAALLPADEPKDAKDPKAAEAPPLVVIDSAGKEQKLKSYSFTAGIVRMSWLADPADDEEPPAKKEKGKPKRPKGPSLKEGPEALLIRDAEKIAFLEGVTTFVPLSQLKAVDFDAVNKTMSVTAATSKDDVKLTGTTAYKGINKVALEADVDKGAAGVASVVYQGGVVKGNLKGLRFAAAKADAVAGRPATVESSDKGAMRTDKVFGLTPVYQMPSGRLQLDPTLLFKKTLRIDVAKVRKIKASKDDAEDIVWNVSLKGDDEESGFTLLTAGTIAGQDAKLHGLLARVPEGWRLFPIRRIVSVTFDGADLKEPKEAKEDKKEAKDKDGKEGKDDKKEKE